MEFSSFPKMTQTNQNNQNNATTSSKWKITARKKSISIFRSRPGFLDEVCVTCSLVWTVRHLLPSSRLDLCTVQVCNRESEDITHTKPIIASLQRLEHQLNPFPWLPLGRVLWGSTIFLVGWVLFVFCWKKIVFGWFGWSTCYTGLKAGWNGGKSIPRSYLVSTEKGWKSVPLRNVNRIIPKRLRLKRLIPIEPDPSLVHSC